MMVKACHNLACRHHGADVAYLRLHARMHQLMRYYDTMFDTNLVFQVNTC